MQNKHKEEAQPWKDKVLSLAAEALKERRKMHVGHNCSLLFPLSREASEKCGAAKNSIRSTLQDTTGLWVGTQGKSIQSSACVQESPWKWAQPPQLPQGCPFSGKASDHSVLYLLNMFFTCHNPPKPPGLPASTFPWHPDSFKSWWQCLHLQKVTSGSLLYATLRLTSKSVIFTLLPS